LENINQNVYILIVIIKIMEGKLSLDLLMGLSIFFFTFIFIAHFLPGVFADVRNEISLMHEAYRLGVVLAEMDGFWRDQSGNGTNWHEKLASKDNPDFKFFPGLAKGEADHLSYDKIRAFDNLTKQNYDLVREVLGLKTFDRDYHFNVSLESLDSTPYSPVLIKNRNGTVVLQSGMPIPISGYVARYERFIWIDPYYELVGAYYIGTAGSRDLPRECVNIGNEEFECEITYPVKLFRINVIGKAGAAEVWWIGICFSNESIPSCNADVNKIQLYFGGPGEGELIFSNNLERKSYDLTKNISNINNMLKDRGFKIGDKATMRIGIKNTDATLDFSDTVSLIAGKAAAKIVIHVW